MSSLYVVEGGALKLGYKVRGKQRVLHLGKGFPLREAREIQRLVDALAVDPDVLPPEMTELLRDVPYRIRESMRRQGLLNFGFSSTSTLLEAQRIVERAGLCPGGPRYSPYGWISLREFCGDDFPVSLLDGERVEAFAVFMSEKYAPKTVYDRFGSVRFVRLFVICKVAVLRFAIPLSMSVPGRSPVRQAYSCRYPLSRRCCRFVVTTKPALL